MNIYMAGPFFIPEIGTAIEEIAEKLKARLHKMKNINSDYEVILPGDLPNLEGANTPEGRLEKGEKAGMIFSMNISSMDHSDLVIACTDNFDAGTMFEIGYAYARGIPVITWSNSDYGSNLMIEKASVAHFRSPSDLCDYLSQYLTFSDKFSIPQKS